MPSLLGGVAASRVEEGVKVLLSGVGGCSGPEGANEKRFDFGAVEAGVALNDEADVDFAGVDSVVAGTVGVDALSASTVDDNWSGAARTSLTRFVTFSEGFLVSVGLPKDPKENGELAAELAIVVGTKPFGFSPASEDGLDDFGGASKAKEPTVGIAGGFGAAKVEPFACALGFVLSGV